MNLDNQEKSIIRVLQAQGRISNVELAEQIGSSESPCYRRVKALEEAGVITGYGAKVDRRKLGLQVTAFILVTVDSQDDQALQEFFDAVATDEYIVECHAMAGAHDYLLKAVAKSMDHFSDLVMKR
ncbi:MAG: Lrp/AsnC family transcriptional regulator, partial [Halieaceae bacterium]